MHKVHSYNKVKYGACITKCTLITPPARRAFAHSYPKCFITTNFDKFHREGAINRSENLRACFRHFPLCFHFNFYISIKLMSFCAYVLLKYLNRKGAEDSLCKTSHPKCFKTTNFDRFHQQKSHRDFDVRSKFLCQISNMK